MFGVFGDVSVQIYVTIIRGKGVVMGGTRFFLRVIYTEINGTWVTRQKVYTTRRKVIRLLGLCTTTTMSLGNQLNILGLYGNFM